MLCWRDAGPFVATIIQECVIHTYTDSEEVLRSIIELDNAHMVHRTHTLTSSSTPKVLTICTYTSHIATHIFLHATELDDVLMVRERSDNIDLSLQGLEVRTTRKDLDCQALSRFLVERRSGLRVDTIAQKQFHW